MTPQIESVPYKGGEYYFEHYETPEENYGEGVVVVYYFNAKGDPVWSATTGYSEGEKIGQVIKSAKQNWKDTDPMYRY